METTEGGEKYGASVVRCWLERPACTRRPCRAMADPTRRSTRTVWRALLVRPLLQLGQNHQMAVASRVGDVPGDSGTTWTRSQQRRGAREGATSRRHKAAPSRQTAPKGVNG